jgi:hypothetical protein
METNSRRAFLATAPAAALLAAYGAVPIVDPIFAAIEQHARDWARYVDLSIRNDCVAAEQDGRTITQEDEAAFKAAGLTADESLAALKVTAPTTLAGMRAAIEHFVEFDKGCIPEDSGYFLATLLRSPLLAA